MDKHLTSDYDIEDYDEGEDIAWEEDDGKIAAESSFILCFSQSHAIARYLWT